MTTSGAGSPALHLSTGDALLFLDLLAWRVPPSGRGWIEGTNALIHPHTRARAEFAALFASTARQLGRRPIELKPSDRRGLARTRVDWSIDHWTLDELGRTVLLLLAAAYLVPDEFERLVHELWLAGDCHERQALLKSLCLLPQPERFLTLGIEACDPARAPLFEAIACDNPYPALFFDEPSFNQLVLEALRLAVPLARISGLDGRWNPELARLSAAQVAVGGSVPPDLARRLEP